MAEYKNSVFAGILLKHPLTLSPENEREYGNQATRANVI